MDIFFQEKIDIGWGYVYLSNYIIDEYNNHALIIKRNNFDINLQEIEKVMLGRKRVPALYFPDKKPNIDIAQILNKHGYKISFSDCWMLHEGSVSEVVLLENTRIVKVGKNKSLMGKFSKTFNEGYSGEKSDDNPYGGWSSEGFLKAREDALNNPSLNDRIEAYLVNYKGDFVACGILLRQNKVGYLAGITSVPKMRGVGFGKLISLFLTKESVESGNTITFLATELHSKNETFYSKIGYKTISSGYCFVKAK